MSPKIRSAIAAAIIAPLVIGPAAAADSMTPDDVKGMIRAYILENPEIVEEALQKLEAKRANQAKEAQTSALRQYREQIFNSPNQVVLGNPKGSVTVVEFFDYNCGYCKLAFPDMLKLLDENKDLRFVLKEFPVLGPGSVEAAKVAAVVNRMAPDRYFDFHKRLMANKGQASKGPALEAAAAVGLDTAKIQAEMEKPAVKVAIQESYQLADVLGINGTPSYVIGDSVAAGAIGIDRLKSMIEGERAAR